MSKPIKVLLLFSHAADFDNPPLRLDREARAISRVFRDARDREAFEVVTEWAVTVNDVKNLLSAYHPEIVHFAGNAGAEGILLDDDEGGVQVVDGETLRGFFAGLSHLVRVVVLNTSNTLGAAEALRAVIDYTIGMGGYISDLGAIRFAEAFYGGLTVGFTVQEAFDNALNRPWVEFESDIQMPKLLVREGVDAKALLKVSTRPRGGDSPRPSGPADNSRNAVFVSYSHRDQRWLELLHDHLKPLERNHAIEMWDDTRIHPGTNWRSAIRDAINRARVAVLLVSAKFLASDFIEKNELPPLLQAAEEEGARILPVIVSPCRFEKSSLAEFQAVNNPQKPLSDVKGANRDRVFLKVADEIESAFLKG